MAAALHVLAPGSQPGLTLIASSGTRPAQRRRPGGDPEATGRTEAAGDEALIEGLADAIATDPASFPDPAAVARAGGMSAGELDTLALRHYHLSVADLVERAAIDVAAERLLAGEGPDRAAAAAGIPDRSAFVTAFERRMAMDPVRYARLPKAPSFDLRLPADYPTGAILAYLGRDPASRSETVRGNRYEVALRVDPGAVAVSVAFEPGVARCELRDVATSPAAARTLHRRLLARLGLTVDPGPFEAFVDRRPELAAIVDGRRGLRIPLVADPFDALIWVIAGQQVSLAAAFSMRRRLILATGERADDLVAPPAPEAVAGLAEDELGRLGFSRAKSRALHEAALAIVAGELDLAGLAHASATRIERTLLGLRGIGPWSANYMLMRGYGFPDCVPVGDSALGEGLRRFYGLDARPDVPQTLALMAPFRPYRSLATFHLWRLSAGGG